MFGFLKKKLGEAIGKFTKTAIEESVEEPPEENIAEAPKKTEGKAHKDKESKKVKVIPAAKEKKGTPKQETVHHKKEEKKQSKEEHKEISKKKEKPKEAAIKETKKHEKKKIIPVPKEEQKPVEKEKPKQGFFSKLFGKKEALKPDVTKEKDTKEEDKEIIKEETEKETEAIIEEEKKETLADIEEEEEAEAKEEKEDATQKEEEKSEPQEKKSFFGKITETFTKVSISNEKFDELFWDIEVACLENNVALEVIEKIKADLKEDLVAKKLNRSNLPSQIMQSMKRSVEELFDVEELDILEKVKGKKPYIITLIGVNGAGKTTTVAKIAHMLKKNNLKSVIGACDTFRAAAIQQLESHANKLGVKMIRHDYGADPAAVAFDTIEHAKAKGIDVVLLDTAGRLHSNTNLMDELKKIIRVAKPDLNIFIGESIAGNDLVEQVKLFNSIVGIDGIILSKADVDEKGGAAISVTYITKKPILYIGTGQEYDDLEKFDKEKIIRQIGIET